MVVAVQARLGEKFHGVSVFEAPRPAGGVSFGPVIIVNRRTRGHRLVRHEYGHSRQSLVLGPLYLPLVGIPSLSLAVMTRMGILSRNSYFTRYPEAWADRLGGVKRPQTRS